MTKRILIAGVSFAAVLALAMAGLALSTWSSVNRVAIERPSQAVAPERPSAVDQMGVQEALDPDEKRLGTDVLLLVGSDSRSDLGDLEGFGDFDGTRADVVMVVIRTPDDTAVMSLPRDLLVEDVCSGDQKRLSTMLEGCGEEYNGATLLTVTVEGLIGHPVDHFALVDLAGFQSAVDAVGGYEICVDNPVRDSKANLELPAGCTKASGEQTLAWLRSRFTQELTDDGWQIMAGVNDLARNERQRVFLIDMMAELSDFSSPQAVAATASAIAPFVTVDTELTLTEAVDLAWALRAMDEGTVQQLDVPVYDYTTEAGAAVLLASIPVDEIVAGFLSTQTAGEPAMAVG